MTMRATSNWAARVSQTSIARATIREVDDNHLCQECKQGDVGHSETHSDFEIWQPLGVTSVPMKQKEQKQQGQQGQQGGGGDASFNKNQPKGEAAEMVMLYANGQRAHPIGMPQDRRCRPYDMEPGEGGLYDSQDGKQMTYFRNRGDGNDGVYIVGCDKEQEEQSGGQSGSSGGNPGGSTSRALYLRYASKKKQSRKPQKQQQGGQGGQQQQRQRYKHEGDGIETQVKLDSKKITYNDGDKEVGHYDRGKKDWLHHDGQGVTHSHRADKSHVHQKYDGAHIWVDGACWSSMPIQIKGDDCS
jgi:hypothetical protein